MPTVLKVIAWLKLTVPPPKRIENEFCESPEIPLMTTFSASEEPCMSPVKVSERPVSP